MKYTEKEKKRLYIVEAHCRATLALQQNILNKCLVGAFEASNRPRGCRQKHQFVEACYSATLQEETVNH